MKTVRNLSIYISLARKKKKKNRGVAIFRNSSLLPRSRLNLENILTYRKTHRTDFNWLHLDFGGKTSWPHKPVEHFVWKGWLQQLLLTSQNRKIYFIFHFSSPPSYNLRRRASFFSVYPDANTYRKLKAVKSPPWSFLLLYSSCRSCWKGFLKSERMLGIHLRSLCSCSRKQTQPLWWLGILAKFAHIYTFSKSSTLCLWRDCGFRWPGSVALEDQKVPCK